MLVSKLREITAETLILTYFRSFGVTLKLSPQQQPRNDNPTFGLPGTKG